MSLNYCKNLVKNLNLKEKCQMSNFFNQPVRKTLTQGAYEVVIKGYNHTYEPHNNKDFMQLAVQFEDGRDQRITYFPAGYDYMMKNLRQQFQLEQTTFESGYALLDSIIGKTLKVWVSYNEYGINFALHDNLTPQTQTTTQNLSTNDLARLLKM